MIQDPRPDGTYLLLTDGETAAAKRLGYRFSKPGLLGPYSAAIASQRENKIADSITTQPPKRRRDRK